MAGNDVHVWLTSLDVAQPVFERLAATLAADETDRARRFRFDQHRHDFITARGILRSLLGGYLAAPPADLRFTYTTHGKPELASGCSENRLYFNLAHAHRAALYAVTRNGEVGVDIEWMSHPWPPEEIATAQYSAREVATLRALPQTAQVEAFYRGWTRKEAFLKAVGKGLSVELNQVEVTMAPGEPARLLRIGEDTVEPTHWSLHHLEAPPGYAAALAVRWPICKIIRFEWTPELGA